MFFLPRYFFIYDQHLILKINKNNIKVLHQNKVQLLRLDLQIYNSAHFLNFEIHLLPDFYYNIHNIF